MVVVLEPFIDVVFKRHYSVEALFQVRWHSDRDRHQLMVAHDNTLELIQLSIHKEHNKIDLQ